jgi:hypothetical protein
VKFSSTSTNPIATTRPIGGGKYTTTITSSTLVGQVTITARDGAISGTATLIQTTGPAGHVSVSLSPPAIVADGRSTTTATATATDAQGNPLVAEAVSFSSSDPGEHIGPVRSNGDGAYTATITSSRTVGQATITVRDGPAFGSATLMQVAQPPSALVVSLSHRSVIADGAARVTVTALVTDDSGHPLLHQAVAFQTSDPADGVSVTSDYNDATYSAVITSSTTVQPVTVTATDYSAFPALSGDAQLIQTPGPPKSITLSFDPASVIANGHARAVVTATITDSAGHQLKAQWVRFRASDDRDRIGAVTAHRNGTYTARITSSTVAHTVKITATDFSSSPKLSAHALLIQRRRPRTGG